MCPAPRRAARPRRSRCDQVRDRQAVEWCIDRPRPAALAQLAGLGDQAGGSAAPATASGRTGRPAGAAEPGGASAAAADDDDDIPDIDELELEDAEEDEVRGLPQRLSSLKVVLSCSISWEVLHSTVCINKSYSLHYILFERKLKLMDLVSSCDVTVSVTQLVSGCWGTLLSGRA